MTNMRKKVLQISHFGNLTMQKKMDQIFGKQSLKFQLLKQWGFHANDEKRNEVYSKCTLNEYRRNEREIYLFQKLL